MDEALLAAYRATGYRVRLARGGWAAIRIDQPLPIELQTMTQGRVWGFITACNPRSQMRSRRENRDAQHRLWTMLRALPATSLIRPGVGVGDDGRWREPSCWVIGPDALALDRLAEHFQQCGYVHGEGEAPAALRLMPGV